VTRSGDPVPCLIHGARKLSVADAPTATDADFDVDQSQVVELVSAKRSQDYNVSLPALGTIHEGPSDHDVDWEVMSTHSGIHDDADNDSLSNLLTGTYAVLYYF